VWRNRKYQAAAGIFVCDIIEQRSHHNGGVMKYRKSVSGSGSDNGVSNQASANNGGMK